MEAWCGFSPSFHLSMWLPFKPWRSLHISFHRTGNCWPFFLFWPSAELEFSVSLQLKCGVAIVRVRNKEVGRWRPHCSSGWLNLWESGRLESSMALKSPHSTLSFQQQQLKEVCHYPPPFLLCRAANIRSIRDKIQTSNKLTRLSLQRNIRQ